VLSTILPTDTVYVSGGWHSSDGRVFTYTVGSLNASATGKQDFVVRYPQYEPQEIHQTGFATPFAITGHGGNGGDADPSDNQVVAFVGVPDLLIADLIVEPLPVQPNSPVTFTVVMENQGTGKAWNPYGGGFYLDIYLEPVASYPYSPYGELYVPGFTIDPGDQYTATLVHDGFTEAELQSIQGFYAKVDNQPPSPYGLVPEYNEMNNVAGPVGPWPDYPYDVYLPLVIR
jgi:hypothetical protein